MSVKGDWPRPKQTTKEEQALRHEYATTDMSLAEFNRRYKKLMRKGLIQRSGRIIKV